MGAQPPPSFGAPSQLNFGAGGFNPYGYSGDPLRAQNANTQSPYNGFQATAPALQQYDATSGMAGAEVQAQAGYGGQGQLISMLQDQAAGRGPSVAQGMLQQATDRNNANAMSQAASARGMNPGLAMKLAMDQGGQNAQEMAGQGATLRAQEMMGARGQLGQVLGQQRGQSLQQFGQLARLQLGQQGLSQQGQLEAQRLNQLTGSQNVQANLGQQGININQQQADQALWGSILSGVGAVGGGIAGAYAGGPPGAMAGASVGSKLSRGGLIPGHASTPGDSYANDNVRAELSPGEIVLPRHITQAPNAPELAAEFVRKIHARREGGQAPDGQAPHGDESAFRRMLMKIASPAKPMAGGGEISEDGFALSRLPMSEGDMLQVDPEVAGQTVPPSSAGPDMLADLPQQTAMPDVPMSASPAQPAPMRDIGAPPDVRRAALSGEGAVAEQGYNARDTQAKIADEQAAEAQKEQARAVDLDAFIKQRHAETNQTMQEIASGKIDPNHFFSQMGTAGKIGAAIAMGLGAVGAALTHTPNTAAQMIDQAIGRDIEAQKLTLQNKGNMLGMYMKQTGDMESAKHLVYAHEIAASQGRIQSELSRMGSANALPQAQALIAQLEQAKVEHLQQAAMGEVKIKEANMDLQMRQRQMSWWSQLMGGTGSPARSALMMSFMSKPEKWAEHQVDVEDTTPTGAMDKQGNPVMQTTPRSYLAKSPEATKTASEALSKNHLMDVSLRELEDFEKKYPVGTPFPGEATGKVKAAVQNLKTNYESTMAGMNRQASPEVITLMDDIVKDPSDVNVSGKYKGAIQFLRKMLNEHKRTILDTYTLGPM